MIASKKQGRRHNPRTLAAIAMIRDGEPRKEIARKLGMPIHSVYNLSSHYKINSPGHYRSECGAYMMAAKEFNDEMREEASWEFAWLCDAARAHDGAPTDAEFAESGESLGKTGEEMRRLWEGSWGRLCEQREKAIAHSDKRNKIPADKIPQLSHAELRDVEVGVAGAEINKKIEEAGKAFRELSPRDPADPKEAAIQFAIAIVKCQPIGNSGMMTFSASN